ncbi:MAG TPA: ATP-binding protein, partial [Polyangiaceae bacterium]
MASSKEAERDRALPEPELDWPLPPELLGREVSVRALLPLWDLSRRQGLDREQLARDTGYSLDQLGNPRERISWQAFATFLANLGRLIGDDGLVRAGAGAIESPIFRTMILPGRLLFGARDLFRWAFGPNGPPAQLVAVTRGGITELAPGRLRLEMRTKAGYEPSRENYLLVRGALEGLVRVFGVHDAAVVQRATIDGMAFDFEIPHALGLFRRVRSWFVWLFNARAAAEEMRLAQLELYDRYVELQHQVEARSRAEAEREKLEEQLRQVQKLEAVGQLAGGIAHDFNNLLSVILSYTSVLIEDHGADDPRRADLTEILKASQRAAALTAQLLAFSRRQVLELSVLDLNEVLLGMDNMIRRIIGEHIRFRTVAGRDIGFVRADRGHVEQVILNLVVNARDAMPEGGELTIETGAAALDGAFAEQHLGVNPGAHVMLVVTDTGVGMDRATQQRIFEPFFTTKPKGRGTGLGLSTVFGIVRQSGGSIWVKSEPGQGSTFTVYLPVTTSSERPAALARADTPRGSETVLLVEDEDQLRAVARSILERHGYRVLEAGNGREALDRYSKSGEPIELLLTDV